VAAVACSKRQIPWFSIHRLASSAHSVQKNSVSRRQERAWCQEQPGTAPSGPTTDTKREQGHTGTHCKNFPPLLSTWYRKWGLSHVVKPLPELSLPRSTVLVFRTSHGGFSWYHRKFSYTDASVAARADNLRLRSISYYTAKLRPHSASAINSPYRPERGHQLPHWPHSATSQLRKIPRSPRVLFYNLLLHRYSHTAGVQQTPGLRSKGVRQGGLWRLQMRQIKILEITNQKYFFLSLALASTFPHSYRL
jgi:hypothetical protein